MKTFGRSILAVSIAALPLLAQADELQDMKATIQALEKKLEALSVRQSEAEAASKQVASKQVASTGPGSLDLSFYGVADVAVAVANSGNGSKTTIHSGGMSSSRMGIKVARDVGDGLKVIGLAEAGILINNGDVGNAAPSAGINQATPSSGGQLGTGSQFFSRQIYAGLSSDKWGGITVGRQYTGSYITLATTDSLGPGMYATSGAATFLVGGMPTRVNNSVIYTTPTINGLSGIFTYTTGSENNVSGSTVSGATTTNDEAGRGYDMAVYYRNGPVYVSASTWDINANSWVTAGETGLAKKRGFQLGGSYDFGPVKVYGVALTGTIKGGNYENVTKAMSDGSAWSLSALFPMGKHKFYASYTSLNDKSLNDRDAKLVGLAYTYEMYKSTYLYASWGKVQNNSNSSYALTDSGSLVGSVPTAGYSPTGTMVGVNYSW